MKGTKKTNVLGLLGIITFIAAELFFALHSKSLFFVFIGGLLVLTALILSIIGLKKKPRVLPIIGLVLSGLEILAAFVFGLILFIGVVLEKSENITVTGTIDGHDYVDLGLSVKWAACNIGASSPSDYGDYYAWGETSTKTDYFESTYKYANGSSDRLTKYCNDSKYGNNGYTDSLIELELSDDVAQQKWGGSWRMPTITEFEELQDNCTWTWTTMNGVNGYMVTSKKSGYSDHSIFLPAADCRDFTNLSSAGEYGYYWSSSLFTGSPYLARNLIFNSGDHATYNSSRDFGQSVRPVCP